VRQTPPIRPLGSSFFLLRKFVVLLSSAYRFKSVGRTMDPLSKRGFFSPAFFRLGTSAPGRETVGRRGRAACPFPSSRTRRLSFAKSSVDFYAELRSDKHLLFYSQCDQACTLLPSTQKAGVCFFFFKNWSSPPCAISSRAATSPPVFSSQKASSPQLFLGEMMVALFFPSRS